MSNQFGCSGCDDFIDLNPNTSQSLEDFTRHLSLENWTWSHPEGVYYCPDCANGLTTPRLEKLRQDMDNEQF